ncbi:hypothetical protein Tco_0164247 [Tanacetum coccineum]
MALRSENILKIVFYKHFLPRQSAEENIIVDPTTTAKEKLVESSVFSDGSSSGADHTVVYVPQWSVTNGSRLDGLTCREMVDEFALPRFYASIRGMEHDQLFTEFNVGAARQMSLSAEVRMRAKFNIMEKRRLSAVVEEKNLLLKTRDEEVANLKAQLLVKEAEATKAIRLRAEVQTLTNRNVVLERENGELDIKVADLAATVKDDRIREMNETFNKLDTDLVELALHLEERFYPHLLTTIYGRRWLLTHGLELAIAKCLNSNEYISSLGVAIGKAVEKGMQEGLSAGITHSAAGRVFTDVAAYNPSAEADYLSALQPLQSVNFSLISELKSNKDASIDTIMNLLRLEDSLAERLNLAESQPHVDQLMVPIYHSPDQTAVAEPLSIAALEGTAGTSGTAPDTTTDLSLTFASTGTIPPISTDDYEIVHTDGQEGTDADGQTSTGADVNPFPSINDTELNVMKLSFFSLKLFL